MQSTFLNAFRGIKRGVVPELEAAWLFKIAHNVCLSRRRSSWRRTRIESPTDFELVEELAPAPSRLSDELVGLQDVLEQMPENQRRAILLREWQGLSYREIADELELSQTAVETLIFRARRSLAQGLEEPPEPARKRRAVRGADSATCSPRSSRCSSAAAPRREGRGGRRRRQGGHRRRVLAGHPPPSASSRAEARRADAVEDCWHDRCGVRSRRAEPPRPPRAPGGGAARARRGRAGRRGLGQRTGTHRRRRAPRSLWRPSPRRRPATVVAGSARRSSQPRHRRRPPPRLPGSGRRSIDLGRTATAACLGGPRPRRRAPRPGSGARADATATSTSRRAGQRRLEQTQGHDDRRDTRVRAADRVQGKGHDHGGQGQGNGGDSGQDRNGAPAQGPTTTRPERARRRRLRPPPAVWRRPRPGRLSAVVNGRRERQRPRPGRRRPRQWWRLRMAMAIE